jgi:hypothetical protein
VSYLSELDKLKASLEEQHPGWQIWYSPRIDRTVVWCARPNPLLNEASPEDLSAAIERAAQADAASRSAL